MQKKYGDNWQHFTSSVGGSPHTKGTLDAYALLKTILDQWRPVFQGIFGHRSARNIVGTALDVRNQHAHAATPFNDFDAIDALGTLVKLLDLVGASKERSTVLNLWQEQRHNGARSPRAKVGSITSVGRRSALRQRGVRGRADEKQHIESGGNSLFIQLNSTGFKRTYYGPVVLTRNNFRGAAAKSAIDHLNGTGVELRRDGQHISAIRMKGCPPCRIDGVPMRVGVAKRLRPGDHRFEIAGISLNLTTLLESNNPQEAT